MNIIKVLMSVVLILAFSVNAQSAPNYERGNGNVITQIRKIADYDTLKVEGSFDVVLVYGEEDEITIEGEENIISLITVEVHNKTLNIASKKRKRSGIFISINVTKPLTITIPFKDLNEIRLVGSGSITTKEPITADEVLLKIVGSGDMTITGGVKAPKVHAVVSGSGNIDVYTLQSRDVSINISGSGDILLKGITDTLTCSVLGSGDIDAYDLKSQDVSATMSGSGDIKITVKNTLKVNTSSSGDVSYKGNPTSIDVNTAGSGRVTKKN